MKKVHNCWHCQKSVGYHDFFCSACKKIQEPLEKNPFEVFEIGKKFKIDLDELEKKHLQFQSFLHPDKFINSSENEQAFSLGHSSKINEAFNLLKNNISRADLLLQLFGFKAEKDNKSYNDRKVLEEIMDLQNECMLVETDNEKKKIKSTIESNIKKTLKDLDKSLDSKELANAYKNNIKLSYLEKMKKSLD